MPPTVHVDVSHTGNQIFHGLVYDMTTRGYAVGDVDRAIVGAEHAQAPHFFDQIDTVERAFSGPGKPEKVTLSFSDGSPSVEIKRKQWKAIAQRMKRWKEIREEHALKHDPKQQQAFIDASDTFIKGVHQGMKHLTDTHLDTIKLFPGTHQHWHLKGNL